MMDHKPETQKMTTYLPGSPTSETQKLAPPPGPVVYVVLSEIFPMGVRGRAVSVVSAVNWATNLLISMTFLTITEKIGVPNIMFLYAAMSFVLLVFVILCVPETKGRTLEEISKELAKKKNFQLRLCRKVQPKEGLIRTKSPAVV